MSGQSSSGPECTVCGGDGFVEAPGGLKPCECQRRIRIHRELPPRYRSARLVDFSADVQREVEKWFASPGDGLLLAGGTGTGKTHLAAAIVRLRIEDGHRAIFQRSAEFYAELRDVFRSGIGESSVTDALCAAPLLVFDDVGAGSLTDFERRSTLEILDQRMNRLLPTVVTTNWSLGKIAELLDERIASRLAAFTAIELEGSDRRMTRGNNR